MQSEHTHTNRLIHAASPYLLQHAHNPVDWYEWGEEAFEKAKREDKLVLVSIGYSACHWCHVMERECFEKEDTAEIMNAHFICIKVDREERPDVDQLYMDAVQLLTGRGGWPLNCFVLPDGRPIHGGTYFPKAEWERTLKSLADFWKHKREEAYEYATQLTNGIKKLDIFPAPESQNLLSANEVEEIITGWSENFDRELGGYNWAPKFPMPNNWSLFLQQTHYSNNTLLKDAVDITLIKMAEGGIYDQAGGGFARYSTDSFWKVPHFEKMLYDNGQLVSLYCDAYKTTSSPLYAKTVKQTLAFIQRELTHPSGAFYSALDADSEGVEGKYYLWTQKELQQLLGEHEPLFSLYYSVDAYGNWEHDANILYKTRSNEELEKLTGRSIEDIETVIAKCNTILLQQRQQRIAPGLDDKVITSWNALMIKGYTDAYLTFDDESYLNAAERAAEVIMHELWQDNELMRIYKNGKVSIHGFAEDYSLTCEAMIKLYEATSNEKYAKFAHELLQAALTYFYDEEKALFYFKAKHDEQLVARKIDVNDDVIPSANSTFAKCLWILGFMFDEPKYHQITKDMIARVQHKFKKFPNGFSNWMQVLQWINQGFYQVVVSGDSANAHALQLHKLYMPNAIILVANTQTSIPLLKEKSSTTETTFFVCKDYTCGLPLKSFDEVKTGLLQLK